MNEKNKKINNLDKKILYYLYENPNNPINYIAKKTRTAKSVIAYRINKLETEKIIRRTRYLFNLKMLGFLPPKNITLQLGSISEKETDEFLEFLKNKNIVESVSSVVGNYDLILTVLYKTQEELFKFIEEMNKKYGKFIRDKKIFDTIYSEAFISKIFSKDLKIQKKIINQFEKKAKQVKLDERDFIIINELRKNARVNFYTIAEKMKLTAEAVRHRIKQLKEKEIILGKDLFVNLKNFNMNLVYIYFTSNLLEKNIINKIKEYCYQDNNIISYARFIGEYDFCIALFVSDYYELQKTWTRFRKVFGKSILNYEILPTIIFDKKSREI